MITYLNKNVGKALTFFNYTNFINLIIFLNKFIKSAI